MLDVFVIPVEQCEGGSVGSVGWNRTAALPPAEEQSSGERALSVRYRSHARSRRGPQPHRDQSQGHGYGNIKNNILTFIHSTSALKFQKSSLVCELADLLRIHHIHASNVIIFYFLNVL